MVTPPGAGSVAGGVQRLQQLDVTGTSLPVRPGAASWDSRSGRCEFCCPACAAPMWLDGDPLVDKVWHDRPRGNGEAVLPDGLRRAFDAVASSGWDTCCPACRAGFRVRYDVIEWGRMSNRFVPRVRELLVMAPESPDGVEP